MRLRSARPLRNPPRRSCFRSDTRLACGNDPTSAGRLQGSGDLAFDPASEPEVALALGREPLTMGGEVDDQSLLVVGVSCQCHFVYATRPSAIHADLVRLAGGADRIAEAAERLWQTAKPSRPSICGCFSRGRFMARLCRRAIAPADGQNYCVMLPALRMGADSQRQFWLGMGRGQSYVRARRICPGRLHDRHCARPVESNIEAN